jgi:hypothetical protein
MTRKSRKRSAIRAPEEVKFVSICTNGSFLDTLDIDRTYESAAGVSRIAQPLPSRRWSGPRASGRFEACGGDTMSGERQYTMLCLSPALRAVTLPSQRSPANLRPLVGSRLEKARALVLKRVPLSTALAAAKRIPDCPVSGRSRATQSMRTAVSTVSPSRRPCGAGSACRPLRGDLFASNSDPIPAHAPAHRSPVERRSKITRQLGAACSEPL